MTGNDAPVTDFGNSVATTLSGPRICFSRKSLLLYGLIFNPDYCTSFSSTSAAEFSVLSAAEFSVLLQSDVPPTLSSFPATHPAEFSDLLPPRRPAPGSGWCCRRCWEVWSSPPPPGPWCPWWGRGFERRWAWLRPGWAWWAGPQRWREPVESWRPRPACGPCPVSAESWWNARHWHRTVGLISSLLHRFIWSVHSYTTLFDQFTLTPLYLIGLLLHHLISLINSLLHHFIWSVHSYTTLFDQFALTSLDQFNQFTLTPLYLIGLLLHHFIWSVHSYTTLFDRITLTPLYLISSLLHQFISLISSLLHQFI